MDTTLWAQLVALVALVGWLTAIRQWRRLHASAEASVKDWRDSAYMWRERWGELVLVIKQQQQRKEEETMQNGQRRTVKQIDTAIGPVALQEVVTTQRVLQIAGGHEVSAAEAQAVLAGNATEVAGRRVKRDTYGNINVGCKLFSKATQRAILRLLKS